MKRLSFAFAVALVLLGGSDARAVVEVEMPLAQLVQDSQVIAVVKAEQVDRETGKGTLRLERMLQGSPLPAVIPARFIGAGQGEGQGNPRDMLGRVQDGTSLVLFLASLSPQEHQAFAYGNGSWFKLRGVGELNQLKAMFVQGEPNLRKTFHGDVTELAELIDAHLAAKRKLPGLDNSVKPGLGPRLDEASPLREPVAVAPDQIEIGPAWQPEASVKTTSSVAEVNYVVIAILLAAALGLLLMLTRSAPGAAS